MHTALRRRQTSIDKVSVPAAARLRLARRNEASQPRAEIENAGTIAGAGASRRPPFPLPALNLAAGAPIV